MSATASQITVISSVCSTVCSGADLRKPQSSASLALVRRIHRWPVDSPHIRPVTLKMFPSDDVIMYYYQYCEVLRVIVTDIAYQIIEACVIRCQAMAWSTADFLSTGPLQKNSVIFWSKYKFKLKTGLSIIGTSIHALTNGFIDHTLTLSQWSSSGNPVCLELRPRCALECHWRNNCW